MIKEGQIKINGKTVQKSSKEFEDNCVIEIEEGYKEYVGRGAKKLAHAINTWGIEVEGLVCADLGASTGGFTQVLLEKGAKQIFAVDVGHGQLHESIKSSPKVVNMEGVNLKEVEKGFLGEKLDLIVCDLSFISILKVMDSIIGNLKAKGSVIILVKPQFELSKADLNREGVVKSKEKRLFALESVKNELKMRGFSEIKSTVSPIKGGDGNVEYLVFAVRKEA
jgi:23S rRNA (cytidine1920-2'-O)/16S rRNA (cytidine1409-2'-O)-methyltransferase